MNSNVGRLCCGSDFAFTFLSFLTVERFSKWPAMASSSASFDDASLFVEMQDPAEWIMELFCVHDESAPESVQMFQAQANDHRNMLAPLVCARLPRVLVKQQRQMFLIDVPNLMPVEEVRHSFTYSSARFSDATITLICKPLVGPPHAGGPLVARHDVQFWDHSTGGFQDCDHTCVWWLSPCKSTLRVRYICRRHSVNPWLAQTNSRGQLQLHNAQFLRVGNSIHWSGQDDKGARISMTHVSSVARVKKPDSSKDGGLGQGWWETFSF